MLDRILLIEQPIILNMEINNNINKNFQEMVIFLVTIILFLFLIILSCFLLIMINYFLKFYLLYLFI